MDALKTKNKDVNKFLKHIKKLGWLIERLGNSHLRITNSNGESTVISNSCSDKRGILNARSDLRKLGADL
jgi:predicted RNA binding protein YcfA (HicA-like mRNA interferase family)